MKPSLESNIMYNSRVFLDSVTVMTVIGCVLSPSTFAIGASDGFIEQPQHFAQCFSLVSHRSLIAEGRTGSLVNGRAESMDVFTHSVSLRPNSGENWFVEYNLELQGDISLSDFANSFTSFTSNQFRDREGNGLSANWDAKTLRLENTRLVGTVFPVDKERTDIGAADGGKTASETPDVPNTKIDADTEQGSDGESTDPMAAEFTGSPEPAGEDLDPNAEKNLISSGWK